MKLDNVSVLIAEPGEPIRAAMLAMLKQQGINACRGVHDPKRLRAAVKEHPYDLIVAADDIDPEIFRFLRSIRMNDAGPNPFTVITVMVDQTNARSLKRAMICGADDILLKPVVPRKVVERAKYIAYNRLRHLRRQKTTSGRSANSLACTQGHLWSRCSTRSATRWRARRSRFQRCSMR